MSVSFETSYLFEEKTILAFYFFGVFLNCLPSGLQAVDSDPIEHPFLFLDGNRQLPLLSRFAYLWFPFLLDWVKLLSGQCLIIRLFELVGVYIWFVVFICRRISLSGLAVRGVDGCSVLLVVTC